MSQPRTSHWGPSVPDATGEEDPAVGLMFSAQGFQQRCTLWSLSPFHLPRLTNLLAACLPQTSKGALRMQPFVRDCF